MTAISSTSFLAALDRWKVPYRQRSRYDRCARRTVAWHQHEARSLSGCDSRGTWDPVGIAVHHSGGPTAWSYVWDGRMAPADDPKVPGPLYVVLIDEAGVADLTGWETSNNVGKCDDGTFNLVVNDRMPLDREVRPGADDYFSANRRIYGFCYRGTTPTAAQRRTMRLLCAAVCEAHGWTGRSVAGHREFSLRKPDPEGERMHALRRDVNALLTAGPSGSGSPQEDEDVLTETQAEQLEDASQPWAHTFGTQPDGSPFTAGEMLSETRSYARAAASSSAANSAAIDVLAKALADLATQPDGPIDVEALTAAVRQAAEDGAQAALEDVSLSVDFGSDTPGS